MGLRSSTPAKKAAATKKAAPAKAAVKKRAPKVEEPEEEVEPEEEEEEETEEEGEEVTFADMGSGEIEVTVRKSQSFTCENGLLDNSVSEAKFMITEGMSIEDAAGEINRARVIAALAVGADFTLKDDVIIMGAFKPALTTVAKSGGSSGGGASKPGLKAKGTTKKASSSGGGGRGSSSHYTKQEQEAIWEDYDANEDDYWNNLDHEKFPNIKIKDDSLEDVAERCGGEIGEKEVKPLYLKNAPKWVKDALAEE